MTLPDPDYERLEDSAAHKETGLHAVTCAAPGLQTYGSRCFMSGKSILAFLLALRASQDESTLELDLSDLPAGDEAGRCGRVQAEDANSLD